jgi:hypothetical protein
LFEKKDQKTLANEVQVQTGIVLAINIAQCVRLRLCYQRDANGDWRMVDWRMLDWLRALIGRHVVTSVPDDMDKCLDCSQPSCSEEHYQHCDARLQRAAELRAAELRAAELRAAGEQH